MRERRGGARYQVPSFREVTPTKLWTLAVLAVTLALAGRLGAIARWYVMQF